MAIRLQDANTAVIKKAPSGSKKLYYFARAPPKGMTPPQLKAKAEQFAAAAPACAAEVRGKPKGERLRAFRGCMSNKLSR